MKNNQNDFHDERYKQFIFNDSLNDFQIECFLNGIQYHNHLSISFQHSTLMPLIKECLIRSSHLKGFHISFSQFSILTQESIQDIFKPLNQCEHLKEIRIDTYQQQLYINDVELLIELLHSIRSFSQIEVLVLRITNLCRKISKEGKQLIKNAFSKMDSLTKFQLCTTILNNDEQENLNFIVDSINSIKTLASAQFNIRTPHEKVYLDEIHWSFHDANNVKDLQIVQNQNCRQHVIRLNELLLSLQQLTILKISMRVFEEQNQVNQLFNTILNLKDLSDLEIQLELIEQAISLSIGEEVREDLSLKRFSLIVKVTQTGNYGIINIRENILNVKNLEKLNIELKQVILSNESYNVLSKWKNQWTQLKELTFESLNAEQGMENFSFLRDSFFQAKSINKLQLKFSNEDGKNNFLCGLGHLENLQTLSCKSLYEKNNNDISKQYLDCFQNLKNLRELEFNNILDKEEILCIGNSFLFLPQLTILKIFFGTCSEFEHLQVFCRNMEILKNLKQLSLRTSVFNPSQLSINQAQMLFQSIQTLRGLRLLEFGIGIAKDQKNLYECLLKNLIKDLSELNILKVKYTEYQNKIRIYYRFSKRLINFSYTH